MATLERIDTVFTPWTPSASGIGITDDGTRDDVKDYTGRHRRPGGHTLNLRRMFYSARHRRL